METETEKGLSRTHHERKKMSSSATTASTSSRVAATKRRVSRLSNDERRAELPSPSPTIQKTKNTLEDAAADDDDEDPVEAKTAEEKHCWAPLHEDVSKLHVADGVALEAKVYGDEDAPLQVVWGHGLGSSMANEDTESLWNFWDVGRERRRERYSRGGMAASTTTTTTTTCEDEEDHNDDSEKSSEEEIIEDVEHAKEENVRIVRYNARGHGYSSPAETSSQAKWENMAVDMLKVANLKQHTRISKKTGKEKKQKLILGGASMGAAVALHAAVQRGDVFPDGIVLVLPPTIYEQRKKREQSLKKKALEGPPPPPRLRRPRPIFDGEPEEVYVPRATVEFGMQDESYVAVSVGAAQSNLPPPEEIANAMAKVPCLLLAWDCGDATHPLKSAEELKKLIPHCEMHVAKTLEDTKKWPRMIRDFIRSISRSGSGVRTSDVHILRRSYKNEGDDTEVTTTDWDTTDHDQY